MTASAPKVSVGYGAKDPPDNHFGGQYAADHRDLVLLPGDIIAVVRDNVRTRTHMHVLKQ